MADKMPKSKVLEQLKYKINNPDDKSYSYKNLELTTGYTKRQLIRLSNELNKSSIEEVKEHKNKGRVPPNAAKESEIEFYKEFKKDYPKITIAQFKDIVEEDIILNPDKADMVSKYSLKKRSYSFYERLFDKQCWRSPIKHRRLSGVRKAERSHLIRPPVPRRGELVQIDGTPFEWFDDDVKYCLHLAVDDATSEVLAGYFTKNECLYGYCMLMLTIIKKYGVPETLYSDRLSVLKASDGNLSNFGMIMKDLGVNMIFALSPQAKGRVERMNYTEQNRMVNDIKRFNVSHDLDSLNLWFNDFYIKYLNEKFSYTPLDPNDSFVEITDVEHYDFNSLFSLRFKRLTHQNSIFSFESHNWAPYDPETGETIYIRKDVEIDVRLQILEKKLIVVRYGKVYPCHDLGPNSRSRRENGIADSKALNEYLENKEKK